MNDDNLALAKITNDTEWQAYRKLFAQECRLRGFKAEALPETRPEPSAETKLSQTIGEAIELWQRDSQRLKGFYSDMRQQLQNDSQYHYYQARSYLENTLSGAISLVEDTIGLSSHQSVNYFIDPNDFLGDSLDGRPTQEQQLKNQDTFIDKVVAKGTKEIANVEQAIYGFFDRLRAR